MKPKRPPIAVFSTLAALALGATASAATEPFVIQVVDAENGWPVPLIELTTTHKLVFHTDNAGIAAIDAPELMGREVWFGIQSHGYEVPPDGFGSRGVRLIPEPGGSATVEVRRSIVAKRLGRLTGAGLFAESQKAGRHADWQESGVFGCDSVQNAVHRGRLFWAWGDTKLPRYPLGIFHMSSATTAIQPLQSLEPPLKLELDYFRDEQGTVRGVAEMEGSGPTWLSGYVSLPDASGEARLVALYAKIAPPLDAYRYGLCVWNEESEHFEPLRVIWDKSEDQPEPPALPKGHPAFWTDAEGREWLLFGDPLPTLRMPADFESWQNPGTWEVLSPQESFESAADGARIRPHGGSIAWNAFRQRWVTVFLEIYGDPSLLGELWYAEADDPTGTWGRAVKVLSHRAYSFYNPRLHPEFTPEDSPVLIFEGTYTSLFSEAKSHTPRHDYNQFLYRLDLDDPALAPAQSAP